MGKKTISALLIEDNPDDAELMKRRLIRSATARFEVTVVRTLQNGMEQLETSVPDLIIADLGLPDSHGLDTVTRILCEAPHIPLVVLSGFDDEAIAIKAVQSGAQDYLVKGQLEGSNMERALFYAIERARLQRELEQHTQEISNIQTNLMKILGKNADAIIVVSEDKHILFTNPAAEHLMGRRHKELRHRGFDFPLDGGRTTEIEIGRPDGARTIAEMRVVDITWEGKPAYLASLRNITERKRAEKALRESEERFSKAFRSSPEVILISRPGDGTIMEANDTFFRLTGYTAQEVIGKKTTELDLWARPADRIAMVTKLKENSFVRDEEYTFRMKSGETRTWLFSAETVNINDEPCILSVTIDITERKKTEEALKRAAKEWRATFDSINDMISVQDKDFRLIRVNQAYADTFGMKYEDLCGKKCYEVFHQTDRPVENCPHSRTLVTGKTTSGEMFEPRLGKYLDVTVSPIFNEAGELTATVHVAKDITKRKKIDEALRFSDAAFKSIHESVIATDVNFTITHWNDISARIYGIEASQAIGRKLLDVIEIVETHPGENDKRIKTLEANGYYQEEQLHRTRQGEVWVDVTFQAIEDGKKRYGWVALATVITQRKQAEEALRRSEEKYREIINTSIAGIVATDSRMKVLIWNQGAEKIFGYKENEMLGQSLMKVIPEKYWKNKIRVFNRLNASGKAPIEGKIIELCGLKKDGTEVSIELSISMRKRGDDYIATAIISDITERKKAEEKLRKIDQMKSEFLSNVSHELRTPLQSISGFTKLIMNGQVPDCATQQEFLQIIDSETLHLGNLINDLLDISRLESGRFQINPKLIPVREFIIEPLKSFRGLARDKNITLAEIIPEQLPEMEVDGERLRQVVINLVDNAIKYSDPGGSVAVKVKKQKERLLFQVSDHGIGIPEAAKAHLFERFYRAEGETVRGGTGLGLYISRQIIEAHGGRIWAESKLGEGSTFSFTLPLNGKGGKGNGKENPGHRRRPGHLKTGRVLAPARRV